MNAEAPHDWIKNLKQDADLSAAVVKAACSAIDEIAREHPKSITESLAGTLKDSFRAIPTNISSLKEAKQAGVEYLFDKASDVTKKDLELGMVVAVTRGLAASGGISENNQYLLIFEFVAVLDKCFREEQDKGRHWPPNVPG